ncbi:hypothetical protein HZB96_02800 [Candidatus Gottesmanbacteria bacterium]|nr:hypothetical protein [Candidatus Gottesmanbacteria bacterium]MBI5452813.1 hypothetical protein [Candidatus Gottesmanbacteria bacterium]
MFNTESKTLPVNIFLFLFLLILSAVQVAMLNKFSIIGAKLNSADQQIEKVEGENGLYSEKIASASSIASISQKAQNIGLSQTPALLSLDTPLPVAYDLRLNP